MRPQDLRSGVCPHLPSLLRYCLQNVVQYFEFTKLGPLSIQLPLNDTLLVIPFFKKKGKYEYCFDSILIELLLVINYCWFVDKTNNLGNASSI